MSVVEAVKKDLEAIRARDVALADSALAASALRMAEEIDDPDNSATSKSMCARVLHDHLDRLRELMPAEQRKDRVDEIAKRRERRVSRAAG